MRAYFLSLIGRATGRNSTASTDGLISEVSGVSGGVGRELRYRVPEAQSGGFDSALQFVPGRRSFASVAVIAEEDDRPPSLRKSAAKKEGVLLREYPRKDAGKIFCKERRLGLVPSIVFEQENGHLGGNKRLISCERKQLDDIVNKIGRAFFPSRTYDLEIYDQPRGDPLVNNGNGQIFGYWGGAPLACLESVSKVKISPERSGSNSHPSAHEQPSDRRQSPDEPKQQDSGPEDNCGREERVLSANEDLHINSSGSKVLLGQEVRAGNHVVKHLKEAAVLTKHLHVKSRQRKLPRGLVNSDSSSSESKPGKKSSSEGTHKPRHARTVYALNRQISILMDSGYREEAYAIYEKTLPGGLKPDSYTYLHLIKGFLEGGEFTLARELFRKVRSAGEGSFCGASEVILYNVMVHGLGSAGFVKEALNLVEEMTGRGFEPDMYTYNSILHSLGKMGKVTEALTVFESMASRGYAPDVVTYNSLISCLGKAGAAMESYKLYERMINEGCLPDHVTFNTLLPILGKTGELALAMNLYKFMTTSGCQPDVHTYTSLVTSLCRANRVDEALLLSVEMTERGCAPNTVTFNSWLDGLCKGGRVVEAHLLFHKMLGLGYVPDKITYSILIDAFCNTEQLVDKSFDLLKDLLKCTYILDSRTSEIVYQSFKKVGMLKQAKRIARNARAKQSRCIGPAWKV